MKERLTTSLIIPTRNRLHDITQCLHSIQQQKEPFDEIIVVDSSDIPLKQSNNFCKIFTEKQFSLSTLLYIHTRAGLPYQRNRGIERARGDLIYFLDDDAVLYPDYLIQIKKVFLKYPGYGGGMGDIVNEMPRPWWSSLFGRLFLFNGAPFSGSFSWSGLVEYPYRAPTFRRVEALNGCAVYRKTVLEKYWFDEKLPGRAELEDADMSWRVGREHQLFFVPHARLKHVPSSAAREPRQDFYAGYVRNYTYLFFKNVYPTNKFTIVGYWWSLVGFFVRAFLKRSWQEFVGCWKGLWWYMMGRW